MEYNGIYGKYMEIWEHGIKMRKYGNTMDVF